MTPMTQKQQKRDWDTRAWLLGILGGSMTGSLAVGAVYPPILRRLDSFNAPFIGHQTAEVASVVFGLLGLLVLPGLSSGLARRTTFFWGLLPLCLVLTSVSLRKWCVGGAHQLVVDWWINLAVFGGCWVISSGPISLIRWMRVRAARHHAALLASYQAQRGALPQEGAWPPPPEYRE